MHNLVTVIIPTIGRPKFIADTVDSVLRQDYPEIEILISDNLPKIPVRSILCGALDPRIRVIERDQRYEFSKHMNLCIEAARGHYVMILSDDDLIVPSYVSSMVSLMKRNDGVIVALGRQKILDEFDRCKDLSITIAASVAYTCQSGRLFMKDHLLGQLRFDIFTYLSLFARKKDVIMAGGFKDYPDGSNADNYLFYSLATMGCVGVTDCFMGYRVYQASTGLSTPFEKLYLATFAYDRDMSSLIWGLNDASIYEKIHLRLLLKRSSMRMLIYRLRNIYRPRVSKIYLVLCVFKVLLRFSAANLCFGALRRKS